MQYKKQRLLGWYYFISNEARKLDKDKCGKWMYFFDNQELAIELCEKAMKENVCYECKCTDMAGQRVRTGVLCFYLNSDDISQHKSVIRFMLDNQLIKRTKNGKYFNLSFKYNNQTLAGEYGDDFEGKIKLNEFIDLDTGEFIDFTDNQMKIDDILH